MKPSSLLPGLIAGIVLGLALWLGSGSLWLLLGGVVLGLMGASLLKLAADPGLSDKMCVCYRRVAGLDVAFLDAD